MTAGPTELQRTGYSIAALRLLAHHVLPRPIFDFADGGAETEYTLRRNEEAFQEIALLPQPLRGPWRAISLSPCSDRNCRSRW
jgi:isopentenyl diphosphate isomerase/L-lactate dehydrogenase-like FMN-dependent dehydrogenase